MQSKHVRQLNHRKISFNCMLVIHGWLMLMYPDYSQPGLLHWLHTTYNMESVKKTWLSWSRDTSCTALVSFNWSSVKVSLIQHGARDPILTCRFCRLCKLDSSLHFSSFYWGRNITMQCSLLPSLDTALRTVDRHIGHGRITPSLCHHQGWRIGAGPAVIKTFTTFIWFMIYLCFLFHDLWITV